MVLEQLRPQRPWGSASAPPARSAQLEGASPDHGGGRVTAPDRGGGGVTARTWSLVLTRDLCEGGEEGVGQPESFPPGIPQVPPHVPPLGNLQVPPPPGHPSGVAPAPWRPVPEDRGLPPPPFSSAHPGAWPSLTLVPAGSWLSQRPPPHSLWVSSPLFPPEHLRAGLGALTSCPGPAPARRSSQSLAVSLASPTNPQPWRCGWSGPRETRPGLGGRAEEAGLLGPLAGQ